MRIGIRDGVFLLLIGAQVWAIVRARYGKCRYFAWAPYDEMLEYEVEVTEGDRRWSSEEIQHRFKIPARGRENRCAEHLFRWLRKGAALSGGVPLQIRVRYSLNGRPSQVRAIP